MEREIFDGLLGFDSDMKATPQLAASWEAFADAKVFGNALRYGLMGRPSAVKRSTEAVNEPSDFEARKVLAEVECRRRVAGKRYIGSELNDARHLNYQRYYGPSD